MNLRPHSVDLPVADAIDRIIAAVSSGAAVITAAPGAGKSTLVPFAVDAALAGSSRTSGRIVMLEPRRLAARATATRLAELLDEDVGDRIGLTIRGERRVGKRCRVEVVTEAVLTNRLQRDPGLPGVDAVIFDEFHERNLHSDLGLAMCLEAREVLRPDLAVVVMSATIEAGPIAELLDNAPVVDVPGRVFPVETEHRARPPRERWGAEVGRAAVDLAAAVSGDVLVFAPGRREVGDVVAVIRALDHSLDVLGVHGGSTPQVHRMALARSTTPKIIVATAVAETSVTFPGVRGVVDGGLARRARFDAATGLGRLETGFVTRFAADQRRGRAGRTGPGRCIRLWSLEDDRHLALAEAPEILTGDPLPVATQLLAWGDPEGTDLPLLDRPAPHRLRSAHHTLSMLGLVVDGDLSERGRDAHRLPTHPRHAALLLAGAERGRTDEVAEIVALLDDDRHPESDDLIVEVRRRATERPIRRAAARLVGAMGALDRTEQAEPFERTEPIESLLAGAWPDRIALARPSGDGSYLLASGREVQTRRSSSLSGAEALVVIDATVDGERGTVRLAVPLSRRQAVDAARPYVELVDEVTWDGRSDRLLAERRQMLGAIVLHADPLPDPPAEAIHRALRTGIERLGVDVISWRERDRELRARLAWLNAQDPERFPDVSDRALVERIDEWLDLASVTAPAQVRRLRPRLLDLLGWAERAALDDLAPPTLATGRGRQRPIDYSSGRPVWRVRIQDVFGMNSHPVVGPRATPLTIELLSPADRVAQTTTDLPGFWAGSYAAVRADLRGRYPKHAWPEDPTAG